MNFIYSFKTGGTSNFYIAYTTTSPISISGGAVIFFNSFTSTSSFTISGSGRLDFRGFASVPTIDIVGSSCFLNAGSSALLEISKSLLWAGSDCRISGNAAGGKINLGTSSVNFIQGAGTTQLLEFSTLTNSGYLWYGPTGSGIRIQSGGTLINGIGICSNVMK